MDLAIAAAQVVTLQEGKGNPTCVLPSFLSSPTLLPQGIKKTQKSSFPSLLENRKGMLRSEPCAHHTPAGDALTPKYQEATPTGEA